MYHPYTDLHPSNMGEKEIISIPSTYGGGACRVQFMILSPCTGLWAHSDTYHDPRSLPLCSAWSWCSCWPTEAPCLAAQGCPCRVICKNYIWKTQQPFLEIIMKCIHGWKFCYFQVVIYPKTKFYLKNPISRTMENYFGRVLCGLTCHLSKSVGLSRARR